MYTSSPESSPIIWQINYNTRNKMSHLIQPHLKGSTVTSTRNKSFKSTEFRKKPMLHSNDLYNVSLCYTFLYVYVCKHVIVKDVYEEL